MDEKPTAASAKKVFEIQSAVQFSGAMLLNVTILHNTNPGRGQRGGYRRRRKTGRRTARSARPASSTVRQSRIAARVGCVSCCFPPRPCRTEAACQYIPSASGTGAGA
jgi:hypothetical protein